MLQISKKILFNSLRIIAIISLVNVIVLYWLPVQFPLSSYLAITLMFTAYMFKVYYLIPIALLICVILFFSAFSFIKERIVLPAILFVCSLCDSFILGYSFLDGWLNDGYFMAEQAVQVVLSLTITVFVGIYFVCLWKKACSTD